jgi:nucleoside-diphosphate-sugar epimerase
VRLVAVPCGASYVSRVRVAVTGGTGFIGRKLVLRHLEAGDSVRVLSRRPRSAAGLPDAVQLCCGDLESGQSDLAGFVDGADVLYHCAAELRDRARMQKVHVLGTGKLLDAATGRIGRWVQLSSVGVYGPVRSGNIDESAAIRPVGEYEKTKWEAERLVAAAAARGLETVVLRPSNVFGKSMRSPGLAALTTLIKKRMFVWIGKPGAIANYIHVDNVIGALVACASNDRARNGVYNLSDWRTFERVAAIVAEELGVPAPSWRIPEPLARGVAWSLRAVPRFPLTTTRIDALVTRAIYDWSRIERELDYRHAVDFETALRLTVRSWHRDDHGDTVLATA